MQAVVVERPGVLVMKDVPMPVVGKHEIMVRVRAAATLAQSGDAEYVERLSEFTLTSVWGVFGWLGVFMDSRV